MKLTRLIVLMGLAAIFMPSPPPGDPLLQVAEGGKASTVRKADPAELAYAAMAAASDAGSFCVRQPQACEIAGRFWDDFTLRLRYTLRLVYEWAAGRPDMPTGGTAGDMAPTGARPAPVMTIEMHPGVVKPAAPTEASVVGAPTVSGGKMPAVHKASADPMFTGSTRRLPAAASGSALTPVGLHMAQRRSQEPPSGSENTLTIEDVLIPWNGPRQG